MSTTIEFDNLEVDIPKAKGPDGRDLGGATWKLNGPDREKKKRGRRCISRYPVTCPCCVNFFNSESNM